jgi:hypothetical protein
MRNAAVIVALEAQLLVDLLNSGDQEQAAITADKIAAGATTIAEALQPAETARP